MKKVVLILASIILCGSTIFAQSNHWSLDNPGAYASHLNTWIAVELDGVRLASTDIELAAFVDGECRGVQHLANWDNYGYLACIQIFKDNAGDVITFKMYDHATSTEYDDCSTTVTTQEAGEEMGATPMDPTVAVFTSPAPVEPEPTGPEHPWVPASFPSNMSIFAEIQINGVPQSGDNWEVGAFCEDECRGDQVGTVPAPTEFGQMLSMVVYGVAGDVICFYLYDIENQSIVGECSTTVTYVEQGNAGVVWDPLILNFVTAQSFTKEILGYEDINTKDRYYLIATPIGQVNPENVTNMIPEDNSDRGFDLYRFNQAPEIIQGIGLEWENWKSQDNLHFDLEPGVGYLYASSEDVTLIFTGTPYSGSGEIALTYDGHSSFAGWNLIGNPFSTSAYFTSDSNLEFYVMNSDGSNFIAPENGNEINAMEGIFVVATAEGQNVTFTTTDPGKTREGIVLNLSHNRGNVIDRAIVRFGDESTLPKIMLNEDLSKLYIPQDNVDFAVVTSATQGEMPVNFKAAENGTYTLNINTQNVEMNYLHLIDNMTGADVNLLETPSYSFNAQTTDYASRFKLVFATGNPTDDNFAFFSNGNWIISNDGMATLQVIDVMGHILSSETISGSFSKSIDAAPGVYMLRLINGNNMKVQKIVVK